MKGKTRSCGCRIIQVLTANGYAMRQHGESKSVGRAASPEYRTWDGMKERCRNPNHKAYANYGGRGISVCERWLDFESFLLDMGRRPSPTHSIDRINNDGNYEPGNCRWATRDEQNRNQRRRTKGLSL